MRRFPPLREKSLLLNSQGICLGKDRCLTIAQRRLCSIFASGSQRENGRSFGANSANKYFLKGMQRSACFFFGAVSSKFCVESREASGPSCVRMYCESLTCAELTARSSGFLFRQLFDPESSTYTYLLADTRTKEALLIDPVYEQVDRDAQVVKELGLDLKFGLNTHVHADHVTGTGLLRKKYFPNMKSVIGATGNPDTIADIKLQEGEVFKMGVVHLEVRGTSGHTNGCHSFVFHDQQLIFTGDAVLIRGCGRTDFQQGNAAVLYQNVWSKILSLPDSYLVYPAHDYKGRTVSSVCEEKAHNPRLTKTMPEFVELMKNLNLPYPKKLDASLPLNRVCGLFELLSPEDAAKLGTGTAASAAPGGGTCSGEPQKGTCSGESAKMSGSPALASVDALKTAVAQGAVVVDVRGDGGEDIKTFVAEGSINCVWKRNEQAMPLEGLPADKNTLMIVHCGKGQRAALGMAFLAEHGYTNTMNGGGPLTPELWEVYSKRK